MGFQIENNVLVKYEEELGGVTSVVVPESVKKIGDRAFAECHSITSVFIPASVTEIGNSAFKRCRSLISVILPDRLEKLGQRAFACCSKLGGIVIPAGLTRIEKGAFSSCESLTSVFIPASITEIGDHAFGMCQSINALELPRSVTKIGQFAFCGCKAISHAYIPDSVTSIGDFCFSGCDNLWSVIIPDRTEIGEGAFRGCTKLADKKGFVIFRNRLFGYFGEDSDIVLPENTTEIEPYAFYLTDVRKVTVPAGVKKIGYRAFDSCFHLESIIAQGVERIEQWAFCESYKLNDVVLSESTVDISADAFEFIKKPVTLHAPAGSYAERYANENGLPFAEGKCL